ncbi:MAG: NAD+ synthase, partial [Candidatus Adiutrix sp.]|nr:NAD+ synthase [Candidatus Adiutrix sp.]
MRCALLQINTTVGDIARNAEIIAVRAAEAAALGADLVLTPEMALTGYPPRDLLLYPVLAEEAERAAGELAARLAAGPALILGSIGRNRSGRGKPLFNQALFLQGGRIKAVYNKRLLPTYDVFDEARYFEPGDAPGLIEFQGRRLALTICEDIWNDSAFRVTAYAVEPLADHPPFEVLVNISASPFTLGKQALRQDMLTALARKYRAHVLYANLVGGNDELVFDGRSLWVGPEGDLLARGRGFAEDIVPADPDRPGPGPAP